jgi:predicted nucleic acid-binding protein
MPLIVLDASAAVELLLGTPTGSMVADRIAPPTMALATPHLLDLEIAQVIRRYVLAGTISQARGQTALQHLLMLDLERYPHDFILPRIWELRHNLTAYDAAYVALAEVLVAPLLTSDERLAASTGNNASIELVGTG